MYLKPQTATAMYRRSCAEAIMAHFQVLNTICDSKKYLDVENYDSIKKSLKTGPQNALEK